MDFSSLLGSLETRSTGVRWRFGPCLFESETSLIRRCYSKNQISCILKVVPFDLWYNEDLILQKISGRHPGVPILVESGTHFFDGKEFGYLILEEIPGLELLDYVNFGSGSTEEILDIFRQLVDILIYLHSNSIAHLDIKLENIIITPNKKIKLIDYGYSCIVSSFPESPLLDQRRGTPCYIAPEIFGTSKYDGFKADIWSLGVVLYAMTTRRLPTRISNQTIFYLPSSVAEKIKKLINEILVINPKRRPSLDLIKIWIDG